MGVFWFRSAIIVLLTISTRTAPLSSAEPEQEFEQLARNYKRDGWVPLNLPDYKVFDRFTQIWVNGKQIHLKEGGTQRIRWYLIGEAIDIPVNSSITVSHDLEIDGIRSKLVYDNGTTIETDVAEKPGHFLKLEKAGARVTYTADKVQKRLLKVQKCYELETTTGTKRIFSSEHRDIIFVKK